MVNDLQQLADWIQESAYTVIFTGAGMSTDSGLPDYRSPSGIWSNHKPIYYQDFLDSANNREEAWRRRLQDMGPALTKATPNMGHQILAQWMQLKHIQHVITQNIDNLHQASGIAEHDITELHGNVTYANCLVCGRHYSIDSMQTRWQKRAEVDDFSQCNYAGCQGYIKTATISFGQPMPTIPLQTAVRETNQAQLFIAIGSSLQVNPAAKLPVLAKQKNNPARLVIINGEQTGLDGLADLVIQQNISTALTDIDHYL